MQSRLRQHLLTDGSVVWRDYPTTLGEKVVVMLAARTDEERKAAIANLTDMQKDIVIASFLRFVQEQGVSLSNMNLQRDNYDEWLRRMCCI